MVILLGPIHFATRAIAMGLVVIKVGFVGVLGRVLNVYPDIIGSKLARMVLVR